MTCLVGLEHDGRVWLAGDSLVTCDGVRCVAREPKVWRSGDCVLGVAGDVRTTDLVATWTPPRAPRRVTARWLAAEFVTRLRQHLTDHAAELDLEMLVGVRGRLYALDSDGGARSSSTGYDAAGVTVACAAALGNLAATRRYGPRFRLRSALRAAAAISPEVYPPWVMVSTAQ